MTMRTFINIAVSIVLALALIFIVRGMAGMIFNKPPAPKVTAAAPKPAAKPEKKAETPAPAKVKTAEAPAPAAAESKPAKAPAPAAAESKPAEAPAPAATESKTAEAPAPAPAESKPTEAPAAAGAGDAEAGKKVFKKCKACHYADKEKNKVGPYLKGVVGRKTASVEGFKYSDAFKAKGAEGLVWTEDNLKKYLAKPKGFIPGNRMSFAGLKKEADIANVIAYLKTMK